MLLVITYVKITTTDVFVFIGNVTLADNFQYQSQNYILLLKKKQSLQTQGIKMNYLLNETLRLENFDFNMIIINYKTTMTLNALNRKLALSY